MAKRRVEGEERRPLLSAPAAEGGGGEPPVVSADSQKVATRSTICYSRARVKQKTVGEETVRADEEKGGRYQRAVLTDPHLGTAQGWTPD